jgi:hypothetical protein
MDAKKKSWLNVKFFVILAARRKQHSMKSSVNLLGVKIIQYPLP